MSATNEAMSAADAPASASVASAASAASVDAALRRFFAAQPPAGRRICVALSGGRDSVALLHALHRYRHADSAAAAFTLSALHVHHGLSPHADAWADFCAAFCRSLEVPFQSIRVDVPRDSGEGLEAAARRGRYRAFAAADADWLALAHHRDDQAETVLLNLLRGAGVAGAAGMPALRALATKAHAAPTTLTLIRPLLDAPRAAIERYAAAYGLRWVDDESNDSRHFRRNFLRHDILPALAAPFPGAPQALARAAGHFAEAAGLLADLARIDADAARLPSGRIGLAAFNRLPPARARNLLRHLWADAGFKLPQARWLEEACRQLAAGGAETCVSAQDGELRAESCVGSRAELRVYRGELYLLSQRAVVAPAAAVWRGEAALPWGAGQVRFTRCIGGGIAAHWLADAQQGRAAAVTLRARQGGERLQAQAGRPRRTVRNLLQESGVPPWERAQLPLLWIGERLAWAGGLGVDARFACPPDADGVLPVWLPAQTLPP